MNSLRLSTSLIALVASALPAIAQAPGGFRTASHDSGHNPDGIGAVSASNVQRAALSGTLAPIHTAPADEGFEYGQWAAGSDYKVSFHDDMTFVPYLGSEYPVNRPLSWRTVSAAVGGVELATGTPNKANTDYRFEYRFAGITEAYDVRSEGVEQTFVVSRLPAVGDLVITGAVTTELVSPDAPPAHQALTFCDDQGQPITRYGCAFAFDAIGDRIPLVTSFENGQITLRVPGAWLESAMLPVVVDPLLSRVGVATGAEIDDVDIGRDDEAFIDNVMIAYVRYASAVDGDLFARLSDDDYAGAQTVFLDLSTVWDTRSPSCAFVGGADHWVIAMSRYFRNATTPYVGVRCHAHQSGDTTLVTNYEVLPRVAGHSDWRPDVGGVESYENGDEALVVFQTDDHGGSPFLNTSTSEVRGVLFDPAQGADGTFGQPFPIRGHSNWDCERPSVNQVAEGGALSGWICAMQVYTNSVNGDAWDIHGKRVDNTGNVSAGTWYSDFRSQLDRHQLQPIVEGNDGRYAVLFTTASLGSTPGKTTSPLGAHVRLERFQWNPGAAAPALFGDQSPKLIASNSNRRWEATGLAFDTDDDSHWVATYRSMLSVGQGAGYCTRVGFNGLPTEHNVTLFAGAPNQASVIACVFDNDHDDFLMAYGTDEATNPLFGQTLEYAPVAPDARSGVGCSQATLSWVGNQQIGAEFNYLRVTNNAPAGHFVVVAFAPHDAPVVHPAVTPGCRLLVDAFGPSYLATLPFQFGQQVDYTIALPEFLDPMTLYFQDWIYDGNAFEGTQRLEVPLVK